MKTLFVKNLPIFFFLLFFLIKFKMFLNCIHGDLEIHS